MKGNKGFALVVTVHAINAAGMRRTITLDLDTVGETTAIVAMGGTPSTDGRFKHNELSPEEFGALCQAFELCREFVYQHSDLRALEAIRA